MHSELVSVPIIIAFLLSPLPSVTVKPLYSEHHLNLEKVYATETIERCLLHRGLPHISLFFLETLPWGVRV